mmetsp:Transcript_14247/g.45652  ORF Transcript_14247/g.45652 Transcript_14247/m.45652 type:complete len:331 (-) Transcript_14247:54-1046(-)
MGGSRRIAPRRRSRSASAATARRLTWRCRAFCVGCGCSSGGGGGGGGASAAGGGSVAVRSPPASAAAGAGRAARWLPAAQRYRAEAPRRSAASRASPALALPLLVGSRRQLLHAPLRDDAGARAVPPRDPRRRGGEVRRVQLRAAAAGPEVVRGQQLLPLPRRRGGRRPPTPSHRRQRELCVHERAQGDAAQRHRLWRRSRLAPLRPLARGQPGHGPRGGDLLHVRPAAQPRLLGRLRRRPRRGVGRLRGRAQSVAGGRRGGGGRRRHFRRAQGDTRVPGARGARGEPRSGARAIARGGGGGAAKGAGEVDLAGPVTAANGSGLRDTHIH